MSSFNINQQSLINALSKLFKSNIISADFDIKPLQGGTIANVSLVAGIAEASTGEKSHFRIVLKIQKKWERYSDPGSWRREYDLYASDLEATFFDSLRWPTCYHYEMNDDEDEFQLWLEYIDGVSGADLNGDMYELAALELGRYQGRLLLEQPAALNSLTNLSHVDLMKNTYMHYRSWPLVYHYIRSEDCDLPMPLRQMLINIDDHADEIFARLEKLPQVLCHRDFWVTNIIYVDKKILLIDWDTSGWGYLGEDLASLIADEGDLEHMVENYNRCLPAYYRGFSEYVDLIPIKDNCIYEMILLKFGYRIIEEYLHSEDDEEKLTCIHTLQKIYDLQPQA